MLNGELELLEALRNYNQLSEMKPHYETACDYIKAPVSILASGMTWTFRTPSVLCNLYRSEQPVMEQLTQFEEIIPYYYKLTGGCGKGAEALMKAEILLNQMDFESAEILSHKALYMAETRHQFSIYVAAMLCMARISVYKGDFENLKYILRSVHQKMEETGEYRENTVVDMAESYIKLLMGMGKRISGWLKDNISIEKKCMIFNIGFANMIYGRYLIEQGEYIRFIGISGQMLGAAGIYNSVLYKIYTLLYIAIADYQLGREEKAVKFLLEAVELARQDEIYLPFMENIESLSPVLKLKGIRQEEFIDKLLEYESIYGIRFRVVKKNDYGLTRREEEIANLAKERYTNKEIALKLHISENTVKSNLKNVFGKIGISARAELGKYL